MPSKKPKLKSLLEAAAYDKAIVSIQKKIEKKTKLVLFKQLDTSGLLARVLKDLEDEVMTEANIINKYEGDDWAFENMFKDSVVEIMQKEIVINLESL